MSPKFENCDMDPTQYFSKFRAHIFQKIINKIVPKVFPSFGKTLGSVVRIIFEECKIKIKIKFHVSGILEIVVLDPR